MFKKILIIVLTVSILFSVPLRTQASDDRLDVTKNYKGVGSTSMHVITISGNQSITPIIILADGQLHNAINVHEMITEAKNNGDIIAAFVGTFFDAYSGANTTYRTLYQYDSVDYVGGYGSHLIYTHDGKWQILSSSEKSNFNKDNIYMSIACEPRIEGIGGTVAWDGEMQKTSGMLNGNEVNFFIDSNEYNINGIATTMDAVPFNENGRTYIPIRFAAEALGLTVEWNTQTQTIKLH